MEKPTKILTAEEFDRLFNDKERFVRIAYSYVNDIEVATDITTDGFMYLWEHRDKLDIDINIKGYIYNYIRTRCISFLRKRKSMLKAHSELYRKELWRIESGINTLSNEELIDKLFESEIVEIYRRELAKMPVLTRNVFLASRLENMTYYQIAQKFNLTVRQEFGIPVSEWLRRQRMARIERMLRSPDIPLCQVAEENGFRMPSTFADYCRRNFGAPPGQLRRQLAEPGNGLCSEISGL